MAPTGVTQYEQVLMSLIELRADMQRLRETVQQAVTEQAKVSAERAHMMEKMEELHKDMVAEREARTKINETIQPFLEMMMERKWAAQTAQKGAKVTLFLITVIGAGVSAWVWLKASILAGYKP